MKDILLNNGTLSKDEINNSRVMPITGRYNAQIIIKYISIDLETFKHYNPGFDNQVATTGAYDLRLPADKMEIFITKKTEILNESMQLLLNSTGSK
jgi:membrane-bound lytic murein transglycosylase D